MFQVYWTVFLIYEKMFQFLSSKGKNIIGLKKCSIITRKYYSFRLNFFHCIRNKKNE